VLRTTWGSLRRRRRPVEGLEELSDRDPGQVRVAQPGAPVERVPVAASDPGAGQQAAVLEVVQELRATAATPVLAVTVRCTEAEVRQAIEAGCVGCLGTPFDLDALTETIARLLGLDRPAH
jgi:CheY-like chemotaxis protein